MRRGGLSLAGRNQRGFAIAPILYLLGLIGVVGGVLFSNNMQVLKSTLSVQNDITVRSDLQGAANTLVAQAVFSTDNLTLCPPRSAHQSPGNPCAAAPVSLIGFTHFTGNQLPANYADSETSGSPTEVGVFAAGAGMKQLDAYGHTYIYCRWENPRSTPAAPAFVLLSAGPDGNLQTKCGDSAALGDDSFIMLSVGEAINRAALWQSDASNNVSYGATGSKVTVDSNGDLTAAGNISAVNAFITNGITATSLTASGDITAKDITASANILGATGSFSNLSGDNLTITGAATINGTTTLGTLTAGATTLDSLTTNNSVTIGGGLTIQNGDLTLANGYSYAQVDSFGFARRLIALSPENDVLLGGHNGTNNIYFLTGNATVGYIDTFGNFDIFGNVTGANGFFGNITASSVAVSGNVTATDMTASDTVAGGTGNFTTLNTTNATVTNTLTAKNLALSGTTTATAGSFTNLNVTNLTASNNLTAGNTVSSVNVTASGLVSAASGSLGTLGVTGTTSLAGLSAGNTALNSLSVTSSTTSGSLTVTGNAAVGGTFNVTGLSTLGSLAATSGAFSGTITAPIIDIGASPSDAAAFLDVEGGTAAASTNGTNIVLAAQNAGSGNKNGGNIILLPGLLSGTGAYGAVLIGETAPGSGASVAPAELEIGGKGPQLMMHSTNACGGIVGFYTGGMGVDGWRIENSGPTCANLGDLNFIEKGSTARVVFKAGGNVGIGTTSPAAALDIAGFMRMTKNSSAPATCSSTNDGSIALNHTYTLCICNGGSSAWVKASDGTTSCAW